MNIVTSLDEWKQIQCEMATKTVGLVHTMGNLHAGHLSLCARAKKENDCLVVCIFVNPTQFNQEEDFKKYPRTLEADIEKLQAVEADYLFLPSQQTLYPDQYEVQVIETTLSTMLEGAFRPGHFTGMLTVVLKVLGIIQPARSYYGEKDFQQLLLIQKMARALFLQTEIIGCETIRDTDGLALSSRNTRLSHEERQLAAHFPKLLKSPLSPHEITQQLTALGFRVDYIAEKWQRRLGAVWVNAVRLIDNIVIEGK